MAVGENGGASQGAEDKDLSQGQGTEGAPKAPEINNSNGSGDGVVPKDDATAKKPEDDPKAKEADKTADDTDEDEDEEDEKVELVEYHEWDDPSAQAAVDLLKEAGVTPAEAQPIFEKAIESGDLNDIDVKALEAKVGKTKALLIMNGVKDYHSRQTTQNTETVDMVYGVFGGEQNWNTVKQWAQTREKSDKGFKKELDSIRSDLDKGGRAAKAAAKDLLKLYNGNPSTKGLGANSKNLTKGDGKAVDAAPLSRADYLTALKKAHAEGASQATIAALDARRIAGKNAGI